MNPRKPYVLELSLREIGGHSKALLLLDLTALMRLIRKRCTRSVIPKKGVKTGFTPNDLFLFSIHGGFTWVQLQRTYAACGIETVF